MDYKRNSIRREALNKLGVPLFRFIIEFKRCRKININNRNQVMLFSIV